jgi:DNA-binding FadR family transcriptional regulator
VVWLDAHKPKAGESVFDLIGPERAERMKAMAAADGEGWFIPASDASWWGLTDPDQIKWVNSKTTPQPMKTYTDKIGPTDRAWSHPGTVIECNPSRLPELDLARQRARAETDARFHRRVLDACHEPMITHPDELTRMLAEAVRSA